MAENNRTPLFMGLWSAGWLCWACLGSLMCLWSAARWRSGFADISWAPSLAWVLARKTGLLSTWALLFCKRLARPRTHGDVRVPERSWNHAMHGLGPSSLPLHSFEPRRSQGQRWEKRFLSWWQELQSHLQGDSHREGWRAVVLSAIYHIWASFLTLVSLRFPSCKTGGRGCCLPLSCEDSTSCAQLVLLYKSYGDCLVILLFNIFQWLRFPWRMKSESLSATVKAWVIWTLSV